MSSGDISIDQTQAGGGGGGDEFPLNLSAIGTCKISKFS